MIEGIPVRTLTEVQVFSTQDDTATDIVYTCPGSKCSNTIFVSFVVVVFMSWFPSMREML